MEWTEGKAIQDQIAYGRLRFFQRSSPELAKYSQLEQAEEEKRFRRAQHQAVLQLAALYDRAYRQVGEGIASVFAIHAMLLEDEDYVENIRSLIWDQGTTAEYAVQSVGTAFGAAFAGMESPYMRARAADIRDISRRVLYILLDRKPPAPRGEGPAILVADEFLPSEVMELDRRRLLGLVARKGSVDSHTAILLRAYHIPAIAEVELSPEWDGHLALLDGFDHRLYLDPDQETVEQLRLRYQAGGKPTECSIS